MERIDIRFCFSKFRKKVFINFSFQNDQLALAQVTGMLTINKNAVHT